MRICAVLILILLLVGGRPSYASEKAPRFVYNAVLVDPTATGHRDKNGDATAPFYISIFEAPCDKQNARFGCNSNGGVEIYSSTSAAAYCKSMGGRLPTQVEWMMAASGLRKNKRYSLIEDRIYADNGKPLANIGRTTYDQLSPFNIDGLGIDVSGTVGMTGNLREWVLDGRVCGGSWASEFGDLNLYSNSLCYEDWDDLGTARCVFDSTPDTIQILDSSLVRDELREYIETHESERRDKIRMNQNNGSVLGSRPPAFMSPEEIEEIKTLMQTIQIPKGEPNPIEYLLSFVHAPPAAMTNIQNYREITFGDSTNAKSADPTQRLAPPPCYDEEFDDIRNFDDTGACAVTRLKKSQSGATQ